MLLRVPVQGARQTDGVQPHWLLALQVHAAPVPHAPAGLVDVHVCVQKCVVLSPRLEHSGALWLVEQSESEAQNFPTPISLPRSPG